MRNHQEVGGAVSTRGAMSSLLYRVFVSLAARGNMIFSSKPSECHLGDCSLSGKSPGPCMTGEILKKGQYILFDAKIRVVLE